MKRVLVIHGYIYLLDKIRMKLIKLLNEKQADLKLNSEAPQEHVDPFPMERKFYAIYAVPCEHFYHL